MTRQDKTGQDRTRQEKTGQDRTDEEKIVKYCRIGQTRTE